MKISTVLLLFSLQIAAHGYGQKKITIDERGSSLEKVFKNIEKQSGYHFVYSNDIIDGNDKVFIAFTDAHLNEVLDKLLVERKLTYKLIDEKFIVLTKLIQQLPPSVEKIKGRVINKETGQPIVGATVMQKGSNLGTTTNENGFFELDVDNSNSVLVISFVGYVSQEISSNNLQALNGISLLPLQSTLTDVVVVGYGSQKRRDLTGAVSSVKGSDIKSLPATSVTDALQGRVAGVEVIKNSAEPGSSANIIIRGISSLNNKGPLYIVDGMRQQGDNFNLQDIETIDVLKDAAAASIYGAAAAGGVIIITTKKGIRNNGKPNVNFSMRYGNTVPRSLQLLNRDEYIKLKKIIDPNYLSGTDISTLPNTNWTDALFKNGIEQNYNLSISGASDRGNYFFSTIYNKEKGVYIDNSSQLIGARLNADLKMGKRIKVGEQLYIWQRTTNPNTEPAGNPPFRTVPIMAIYDSTNLGGGWGKSPAGFGGNNPVGAELVYSAVSKNYNMQANAFAEVTLPFHLLFRTTVGYTIANETFNAFSGTYDFGTIQRTENSLEKSSSGFRGLQNNYTLTYDQKFGQHHITALIGYEQLSDKSTYVKARQTNQAIEQPSYTFFQTSTSVSTVEGGDDINGLVKSQFGRLNYDFAGKYFISGSVRRDGNFRKFGPGNQYGVFPAVSAGWKLSDEEFIKNSIPSISLLKLRASYGVQGNDNIPDYIFLSTYGRVGAQNFIGGGTRNLGFSLNNIPNNNIKWESIIQSNIAIDGELMNGKIFFTVEYYNKKTKDMLYGLPVPSSSGINNVFFTNIGSVRNKGLEFLAGFNGKKGNLNYSISANAAFNENKVLNLDDINKNPINSGGNDISGGYGVMTGQSISRTQVSQSFGEFYGFRTIGIYQSDADVAKYPQFDGATPQPGDLIFEDINKDGKLNDDDRTFIGNPNPKLVYGFNINLNWKGIDVAMLFNGVSGVNVFNGVKPYAQYLFSDGNTTSDVFNASYLGSNALTNQPSIGHKDNSGAFVSDPYGNYSRVSSYFVEKGDYLKLKNLQVGYTFNQDIFKAIGMKNARLFFMANNVFTITKYSGLDPEIAGGVTDRGIDVPNFYPHARTYSFGIDVNF